MPDLGRSPRRDPSKRNSITDRLLGSFNKARADTTASIQRRTSSAKAPPAGSPISRIREWLDTCNREHDHHCCESSSAHDVSTFRPTWLIDCADRCLVKSQPDDRYVCLSYVWGSGRARDGEDVVRLVKDNVDVYEDAIPEEDLPQTVIDAMWASRKLGLRYLWVDKLCIVQDDREEMEKHQQHMAYVFANAYLTFAAACGDIYSGLTPLNPKKQGPMGLGRATEDHEAMLKKSKWNGRGWTMEEALYARRKVFFFEEAITWECHCDLWQGTPSVMKAYRGRKEGCLDPLSEAAFAWRHRPWPDLDEYARIASDYSRRRVTSVDDTLRAFSGVTHVLSRIFPGGFLYGMPLMFLDIALLWRPAASIRRRAVLKKPFLPSWSWMGWWFDGVPADLNLWRAAADYVVERNNAKSKRFQSPNAFKIKPTLTWALTDRAASVPVNNNGLQYRDLRSRRSTAAQYPPGWSRAGQHFKHDSDDTALFKYPIPVEDPPEEGDYPPPAGETAFPGPFLSFKTTSAYFEVEYDATLSARDAAMNPPVAVGNIWSKSNRWAGSFRAHDGWLGIQSSNYDGDEALEFIAISTATERRGSHVFNEEQFDANKDADDFVDIVNVLWVERIGEVRYRRGLGHILVKAWDAQDKEEVDVLLG